jgi:PhnB protein
MTKAIPDGFHAVTPSLVVNDAKKAIDFYKKAFDAKELYRFPTPDGKILHAMIKINDSFVMLSDEFLVTGIKSPTTMAGTTVALYLYVEDSDKIFKQAVEAGAIITMPIMNAFWGDRFGTVLDPFGHSWAISTHKIDMTPEGLRKAGEGYFTNLAKQ